MQGKIKEGTTRQPVELYKHLLNKIETSQKAIAFRSLKNPGPKVFLILCTYRGTTTQCPPGGSRVCDHPRILRVKLLGQEIKSVILNTMILGKIKIAVFNGKRIYKVFSGKKEFTFGKQHHCIDGTNTNLLPTLYLSCALLNIIMILVATVQVPFYSAPETFRDLLNGL